MSSMDTIQEEVERIAHNFTDIQALAILAGDEHEMDEIELRALFDRYGIEEDQDFVDALDQITYGVKVIGHKYLSDSDWEVDSIEVTTGGGGPSSWFSVDYNGDTTSYASWAGPKAEAYAGRFPALYTALAEVAGER